MTHGPRRTFALFALVLCLALAGACSDGGGSTPAEGAEPLTEAPDIDPDGVVRIGYDLVAASRGGFSWNPADSTANVGDLALYQLVYGGLMRTAPDGSLIPDLAESATIVDGTTIDIVLRDGVVYADGSTLTAELVKRQLEANLDDPDEPAFQKAFFSLETVDVTGPNSLRLTIDDGTAASWYDTFLAGVETIVIPPGVDHSRPSGAGPFRVSELQPEVRAVLMKNPNYWDADSIKVAGIELVNVPPSTAAANALRAGQVDFARVQLTDAATLGSDLEVLVRATPGQVATFTICRSQPPVDDPRVRKALNKAIDRDAINEAIYDGQGVPAHGVWPEGHRFYLDGIDEELGYDLEGARQLLADAGYPDGFTIDILPIPMSGMPEIAQIVQQQWAEIGVTANIVPSTSYVEDLYANHKAPLGLAPVLSTTARLGRWITGSSNNLCNYSDREFDALAAELATVSSSEPRAVELWHDVQRVMTVDALEIFIIYGVHVDAYDPSRLGGVEVLPHQIVMPDLWQLYVKA